MTNIFVRVSKSWKIIRLCEKPTRYIDLRRESGISDRGLSGILERFVRQGIIRKRSDGLYELTAEGRAIIPQAQLAESLLLSFETEPKLLENVTISHLGLKGKEGKSLVREVAQALKRYLDLHSNQRTTIIVQFEPSEFPSPVPLS
jgi:predicted transcriptional regulator